MKKKAIKIKKSFKNASRAENKLKSSQAQKPWFQALTSPHINYSLVSNFNQLSQCDAIIYYFGHQSLKNKIKNLEALIESHALDFQVEELKKTDKKNIHFIGRNGPVWIIFEDVQLSSKASQDHQGFLNESDYAFARDQFGLILPGIKQLKIKNVSIYFQSASPEAQLGALLGLELASYNFLKTYKNESSSEGLTVQLNTKKEILLKALDNASAVQLSRHLVNLPPNKINPATIESIAFELPFSKNTEIIVWDEKKCEEEQMGLLCAVGAGSATAPRMIHFKYRPKNNTKKSSRLKPIAFVGKGITFDTGGLDIKPSSGMRLMKKDMGGAAAVLALAYWADRVNYERACDFYLALAENSVDGFSMRPSDVYKSRAGHLVEIDNTDAEGRLVLADVMDVAVKKTGFDEPEYIIDIATLTGAIKVALGADVAGLFSNDDQLAQQLMSAGQKAGEPNWRMPLVQKYFSGMSSHFADFKNSADGFGGAITAALFLQKFTNGKKWAHLDVYCWNDKPNGALAAGQASGQPVQSMIQWLSSLV